MRVIVAFAIIFFLEAIDYSMDRADALVLMGLIVYGFIFDIIHARKKG